MDNIGYYMFQCYAQTRETNPCTKSLIRNPRIHHVNYARLPLLKWRHSWRVCLTSGGAYYQLVLLSHSVSQAVSFLWGYFPRLYLSELRLANRVKLSLVGLARNIYLTPGQPIFAKRAGFVWMRVEKINGSFERCSFAPFCQRAVVIGFLSFVLEPIRREPDSWETVKSARLERNGASLHPLVCH